MRKIFGKNIEIRCTDESLLPQLKEELSLYPEINDDKADFLIEILPLECTKKKLAELDEKEIIHFNYKTGSSYFVFSEGELSHVYYSLKKPVNKFHGWIQRFRHMGYNNRIDRIGLILHENVLVPSVIFDVNAIPIHSSAVQYNGNVILFGGRGGVGKTSLELELCFYKNAYFIADDISVMSLKGVVYPNLSYPKIYGYNVNGQPRIKEVVLERSNITNRLHWNLHRMKGANKVRRRISPAILYKNYLNTEVSANRYVILNRSEGSDVRVYPLNPNEAANITIEILQNELSEIFDQLRKQENLRRYGFSEREVLKRWESDLISIFNNMKCEIINIPQDMDHEKFKETVVSYFS